MPFYTLNPLQYGRWDDFVASHPRSSVFHRKGWLLALARTYGYRPVALTSTPAGEELADAIVFCEVNSWITGNRLVSLPFADHTEPLLNGCCDGAEFTEWLRADCRQHNWKYIELRPLLWEKNVDCPLLEAQSFWFHTLDLTQSLEEIYRRLHRSCIQSRIRRAEREKLSYERGCSEGMLDDFYRLLIMTRRRHHLPPQPRVWFQNLAACMSPNIAIRVARKDGVAIAATFTLQHRQNVMYKYACSDERFHHFGGMPFLIWKMIEESREAGAEQIDFGRTDLDNDGLIEFKDRLGTIRKRLTYLRYRGTAMERGAVDAYPRLTRRLFSVLPDALSSKLGQRLYRHIG